MKKRKIFLGIALAGLCIFGLASCGGDNNVEDPSDSQSEVTPGSSSSSSEQNEEEKKDDEKNETVSYFLDDCGIVLSAKIVENKVDCIIIDGVLIGGYYKVNYKDDDIQNIFVYGTTGMEVINMTDSKISIDKDSFSISMWKTENGITLKFPADGEISFDNTNGTITTDNKKINNTENKQFGNAYYKANVVDNKVSFKMLNPTQNYMDATVEGEGYNCKITGQSMSFRSSGMYDDYTLANAKLFNISYEYDENTNVISHYVNGVLTETYKINDNNLIESKTTDVATYSYTYDEKGLCTQELVTYIKTGEKSKTVNTYNDKNQRTSETTYQFDNAANDWVKATDVAYAYDENGHNINRVEKKDGEEITYTLAFNDDNLETESTYVMVSGTNVSGQKTISEYDTAYKIKRTDYTISSDPDDSTKLKYSIEYSREVNAINSFIAYPLEYALEYDSEGKVESGQKITREFDDNYYVVKEIKHVYGANSVEQGRMESTVSYDGNKVIKTIDMYMGDTYYGRAIEEVEITMGETTISFNYLRHDYQDKEATTLMNSARYEKTYDFTGKLIEEKQYSPDSTKKEPKLEKTTKIETVKKTDDNGNVTVETTETAILGDATEPSSSIKYIVIEDKNGNTIEDSKFDVLNDSYNYRELSEYDENGNLVKSTYLSYTNGVLAYKHEATQETIDGYIYKTNIEASYNNGEITSTYKSTSIWDKDGIDCGYIIYYYNETTKTFTFKSKCLNLKDNRQRPIQSIDCSYNEDGEQIGGVKYDFSYNDQAVTVTKIISSYTSNGWEETGKEVYSYVGNESRYTDKNLSYETPRYYTKFESYEKTENGYVLKSEKIIVYETIGTTNYRKSEREKLYTNGVYSGGWKKVYVRDANSAQLKEENYYSYKDSSTNEDKLVLTRHSEYDKIDGIDRVTKEENYYEGALYYDKTVTTYDYDTLKKTTIKYMGETQYGEPEEEDIIIR